MQLLETNESMIQKQINESIIQLWLVTNKTLKNSLIKNKKQKHFCKLYL